MSASEAEGLGFDKTVMVKSVPWHFWALAIVWPFAFHGIRVLVQRVMRVVSRTIRRFIGRVLIRVATECVVTDVRQRLHPTRVAGKVMVSVFGDRGGWLGVVVRWVQRWIVWIVCLCIAPIGMGMVIARVLRVKSEVLQSETSVTVKKSVKVVRVGLWVWGGASAALVEFILWDSKDSTEVVDGTRVGAFVKHVYSVLSATGCVAKLTAEEMDTLSNSCVEYIVKWAKANKWVTRLSFFAITFALIVDNIVAYYAPTEEGMAETGEIEEESEVSSGVGAMAMFWLFWKLAERNKRALGLVALLGAANTLANVGIANWFMKQWLRFCGKVEKFGNDGELRDNGFDVLEIVPIAFIPDELSDKLWSTKYTGLSKAVAKDQGLSGVNHCWYNLPGVVLWWMCESSDVMGCDLWGGTLYYVNTGDVGKSSQRNLFFAVAIAAWLCCTVWNTLWTPLKRWFQAGKGENLREILAIEPEGIKTRGGAGKGKNKARAGRAAYSKAAFRGKDLPKKLTDKYFVYGGEEDGLELYAKDASQAVFEYDEFGRRTQLANFVFTGDSSRPGFEIVDAYGDDVDDSYFNEPEYFNEGDSTPAEEEKAHEVVGDEGGSASLTPAVDTSTTPAQAAPLVEEVLSKSAKKKASKKAAKQVLVTKALQEATDKQERVVADIGGSVIPEAAMAAAVVRVTELAAFKPLRCGDRKVECCLFQGKVIFPAHVMANSSKPVIIGEQNKFVTIPRDKITSLSDKLDEKIAYTGELVKYDLAGFDRDVAVRAGLDHQNLLGGWKSFSAQLAPVGYKSPATGNLVGEKEVGACPGIEVSEAFITHRAYTTVGDCGRLIVVGKEDHNIFVIGMHTGTDRVRNYASNLMYAFPELVKRMGFTVEKAKAVVEFKPRVASAQAEPKVVETEGAVESKGGSPSAGIILGASCIPVTKAEYDSLSEPEKKALSFVVLPQKQVNKFRGAPSSYNRPDYGGADLEGCGFGC